jgi:SAM-dependent methyltransferase
LRLEAFDRLKQATRWMWSLGDYPAVARLLEPAALELAAACDLGPGVEVLDVAAGTGNFALAAAATGANVVASDYAPRMLELGRARTAEAGARVEWMEGDAESLPFADGGFDVVASVFGAMFAPRPDLVASEMYRVCRPGGLVAMANYTPTGFLADFSRLLGSFSNPPPMPLPWPFDWGIPDVVRKRLGELSSSLVLREEPLAFTADFVLWERTNAPTIALRQALPPDRYGEFRRKAEALMDGRELASTYLVVLARKPS